ncbi:kinase [Desulfosarcina ovata]|uniref:GHMP kinase n=1 Tax=Desulfosarcina ovata subsp. ovata TaxID=2752305 RepID=A0A5K8A3J7_9BACT|nr:kinase [Desulfosarcina ovata]BBO86924.1 GHMP kinase [Desulfosarcina ovata subsp. ovata]
MIISKTPVRLSFFGGGTDYREYFERKDGAVLGVTIDKHIYVSVNVLSDFFEYNIRVGYSKSELVNKIDNIVHPSVRETLRFKKISGNLDIHIFADLPAKTGLGSSSSFTVGLLNALYALEGKAVSKKRLAEEAIYIEQQMIKEHVGCQDQIHAAHGGLNIIEFNRYGTTVRPVVISKEKYRLLNASLMVFYTGLTRYASKIAQEQISNTKERHLDGYLSQMHQMVYDAEHIISDETPELMIRRLGEMLNEGWQLKKNLSKKITNATIDAAYEQALQAGAYGGKLGGAGGGGFLFLLVPEGKQATVRKALNHMMEVHFHFETEGSKIIYLTQ